MADTATPGVARRAVMYVRNDCTTDIRVLREAATLRDAGWSVTIMAHLATGRGDGGPPATEVRDGIAIIRTPSPGDWSRRWRDMRYYPWRALRTVPGEIRRAAGRGSAGVGPAVTTAGLALVTLPYTAVQAIRYMLSGRAQPRPHGHVDGLDRLAWWRLSVHGWADASAAAAPPAEVHHGHDLTGLLAALRAARRQGGTASVVYDSHELFVEAGDTADRPWWLKRILAAEERRSIHAVAAIVTVNRTIADELQRRYGGPPAVIVRNTPPRQPVRDPRPDLLRAAAGIPPAAGVILYHGGFLRDRGLQVLAEAMLEPAVRTAHLVFMGSGPLQGTLQGLASEARFEGRLHVLPAVPPDSLLDWVASADVSAMPNQPRTLNERSSTPNKLFESLAVGTPVVGSDFPERRAIVIDDPDGPLGRVCDPTRPRDLARALGEILALDPAAAADLRRRCQHAARERWNWELESARLLAVYDGLSAASGPALAASR